MHRGVDEELHSMLSPHAPFPLSKPGHEDEREVDPVGLDAIVHPRVGLDPIAVDIARVRFLGAEAAIDVDVFDPRSSKGLDCGTKSLQEPSPPRCETEMFLSLFQCRRVSPRRKRAGLGLKCRDHPPLMVAETLEVININDDKNRGQF